ncbi:hypothetical protein A6D6_02673 [Alcanivorax xiamenensis]|uniref:Uncharacterized protein n=1 Tax=Alcanivorax xiamenensis TaxID=1177156 RepID=A0ABQ6Y6D8_9GAMM|nr:hypothetical protein [Alcanivorax xiamenensis]KAF0804909.1 hypothetical protein A6D6_02673 [Alcanivorax xiamenensis]
MNFLEPPKWVFPGTLIITPLLMAGSVFSPAEVVGDICAIVLFVYSAAVLARVFWAFSGLRDRRKWQGRGHMPPKAAPPEPPAQYMSGNGSRPPHRNPTRPPDQSNTELTIRVDSSRGVLKKLEAVLSEIYQETGVQVHHLDVSWADISTVGRPGQAMISDVAGQMSVGGELQPMTSGDS